MLSRTPKELLGCSLALLMMIAGCSGDPGTETHGPTGSLSIDLHLANGTRIDEVWYNITRSGMEPMSGFIDTSAPGATASVEVFGLLPGGGYLAHLRAIANDDTTCEGSAPFSVVAGEKTDVGVMLNCNPPERFGSVRVNGELNVCAELTKAVVAPLQTSVGASIDLRSQARDAEGDPVRYAWSSSAGPIDAPQSANTRLRCASPGWHFVRIDVSDDDFRHCIDGWTVEVNCVRGDGGAGGTGGAADGGVGTGGSGGILDGGMDGGAGGSAGSGGSGGSGSGGTGGAPSLACDSNALPRGAPTAVGLMSCDALGVIEIPIEVRFAASPLEVVQGNTPFGAQAQLVLNEETVGDLGLLVQEALLDEASVDVDQVPGRDSVYLPARVPCTIDFGDDPDTNGTAGPITVTTSVGGAFWTEMNGMVVVEATDATFSIAQPVPLTLSTKGPDPACFWVEVPRITFEAGAGGTGGFGGTGGSGGSGGTAGTGGSGNTGGAPPACLPQNTQCMNGFIDPIVEDPTCMLDEPPSLPDVCSGLESVENPTSCTLTGNQTRLRAQALRVLGDCNVGFDLDGCDGQSCEPGGLAPGEGLDGVDNALAGLAPVLAGVGGNLGGVDQAFYDGLCDGSIDWQFIADTNPAEGCATVIPVYDGIPSDPVFLNLSESGCVSGTMGTVPLTVSGVPGSIGNATIRGTTDATQGFNVLLGGTADAPTAVAIAEALLVGAGAVVGQVFDINEGLEGDIENACNAISLTLEVGGVLVEDGGG